MLYPLLLRCNHQRCLLARHLKAAQHLLVQPLRKMASKGGDDIQIPPEPTTCCMSGCANCVWIEYAEELSKLLGDNDDRIREIILSKISDPNLKMFLDLELRNLKHKRTNSTTKGPEEPKKTP